MKRTFKKTFVALIAAATMAVGMSGMSTNAYNYSESWSSRYVNGAPGSESYTATCSIVYSTYGAICYCNAVSNSVNGGSGVTYVNSVNGTMEQKSITNTGSVTCKPTLNGAIECSTYKMSAYTAKTSNTFNSSGNIVTKTTS